MTVAGVAAGIEVLAVNVTMLAEDLVFNFLPSRGESSYILQFDEIDIPGNGDNDGSVTQNPLAAEWPHSSVSVSDVNYGKVVTYPKERVIRSLIVRVRRSSLEQLIQDFDSGAINNILATAGHEHSITW